MMNKQRFGLILIIAFMIQGCSIPLLQTKKAQIQLPEHYDQPSQASENFANNGHFVVCGKPNFER